MRRWKLAVAGSVLIVTFAWVAATSVAGAQVTFTKSAGACTVVATISGEGAAETGSTLVVPHKGSASYTATVAVEGEDRPHNGDVWAETPIPGVNISIHPAWGGLADGNSDSGVVTWDIPGWVPGGIIITVSGFHNDEGVSCSGSQDFTLDGGFMDSPVGPVSAAVTILAAVGLLGAAIPGKP